MRPLDVVDANFAWERQKRLDEARSRRFMVVLEGLAIIVDNETAERAFEDLLYPVRARRLSACDAACLELAIRRGCGPRNSYP